MFIVREFHANVPDAMDNKAMVRHVFVYFGASDIGSFYGMRDVGQGEYKAYLENVDDDDVIQALTIERKSEI